MVLGTKILLDLIKKQNLIENLSERELTNPEGCVIDIRIKSLFQLEGKGFLGIETRMTPEHKLLASYDGKPGNIVTLQPGEYYTTESLEKFNMPKNLFAVVKPRTTLFRSGVIMRAAVIDPGYSGEIHPALYNASHLPFDIEMGARYLQVFFMEIKGGNIRSYEGQWQGGRKAAVKEEKQI